jgi:DNA-directed RNA polymerase subunit RPC12/RpoP
MRIKTLRFKCKRCGTLTRTLDESKEHLCPYCGNKMEALE